VFQIHPRFFHVFDWLKQVTRAINTGKFSRISLYPLVFDSNLAFNADQPCQEHGTTGVFAIFTYFLDAFFKLLNRSALTDQESFESL